MRRVSFVRASPVLFVSTPSEVQFNCPWCNTRLALSRNDFANERAVMCPRCNNPVDLEIQRRLAKQVPATGRVPTATSDAKRRPAPPAAAAPPPVGDTAPAPAPPQPPPVAPREAGSRDRPLNLGSSSPLEPIRMADIDATFGTDATRLGDVDALTGGRAPLRSKPPEKSGAGTTPSSQTGMGVKLKCPSCNYENAPVPPEFSFGTVQKCSWCGKPLPK